MAVTQVPDEDWPELPESAPSQAVSVQDDEVMHAFHETYRRVGLNTRRLEEAEAQVFALVQLLVRKGVVGTDEVDRARSEIAERMDDETVQSGLKVQLARVDDKYAMEDGTVIDCDARLHLCKAACCRLRFALSSQDVEEGVVQWTLDDPYLNRVGSDGWCSHLDRSSGGCGVYEQRPAVCRSYDCRKDPRIWVDFDERIPNPKLDSLPAIADSSGTARLPLPTVRR